MSDIVWSYHDSEWTKDTDLVGYAVEAQDGHIGHIDEASGEIHGSWLVVDTGPWIFGKKRLIPAGTVSGVDHEHELVIVNMTKGAIKAAPDYDPDDFDDEARGRHTEHYRPFVHRGHRGHEHDAGGHPD